MPAVTNFLVSSLPNYVATNRDMIIKSFGLVGAGTRGRIGLQTGVKHTAALNYLDLAAEFQDGSGCGFNPLDSITLSQKNIVAAAIKVDGQICPETLLGKYAEYLVRVNATENELPFEQYILDALVAQINKGIETLIWQGDTASQSADLKWIDGFLKIAGAATGVISVSLTASDPAWDSLKAIIAALPVDVIRRGDVRIYVAPEFFL